ncbi:protein adenylyltransferase SelO [uncultured Sulfitobacter sp.]|uniref:protein adenylyltransferase SelO n=1 Tax=uncultured Sulfitobacter sp. TaxID=191468 RepID=UPI002632136E|nr:YdiU family protein [uncultured Sulfitobacter sp.]
MELPFDNSFAALPDAFYTRVPPTSVKAPKLLAFNDDLAKLLGISKADDAELAQIFSGNFLPQNADPLAQLYAGHQFGNFNPQLGDGRAILLGEVIDTNGVRHDIQLKGSGRTPYSRGGDGRAWLGPVLREYVVSEAMYALGVPTTRALAAVSTGEDILREQGMLPGAILTRTASSHLRVGTFQVFAHRGQVDELRTLTNYAIKRHYPEATGPMDLLRAVCTAQANLIAQWMSIGFVHGVMNTDNCAIGGETIDYGPCAFMDDFNMGRVFSSIDQQGRYAYGNQPNIAIWNMAQLATALLQLFEDKDSALEEATAIIHAMPDQIETAWLQRFAAKIGIAAPTSKDTELIQKLLDLMQTDGADFTNTFRALSGPDARDQFTDRNAFDAWATKHAERIAYLPNVQDLMNTTNPAVIPRNHRIEQMIQAAIAGDMEPFNRLMTAYKKPYTLTDPDLANPPTQSEIVPATFCGT